MTMQVDDRLSGQYVEGCDLIGELPLPGGHPRIVERPEPWSQDLDYGFDIFNSTACRRSYVAQWLICDDTLFLVRIDGRLRVVGDEPLVADWISQPVQLGRDVEFSRGPFKEYGSGREIDVVRGRVVRRREVDTRIGWSGPVLKDLPGGHILFANEISNDPAASRPRRATFEGAELRDVCATSRRAARLRPGDLAERIGMKRAKGGLLVEWESGARGLPPERVDAVCDALGIDRVTRAAILERELARFAAADTAWLDTPVTPWLEGWRGRYAFPNALTPHADALAWARRCVHVAWVSGTLHLDRRRAVAVCAQEEWEPRPLPPEAEALLAQPVPPEPRPEPVAAVPADARIAADEAAMIELLDKFLKADSIGDAFDAGRHAIMKQMPEEQAALRKAAEQAAAASAGAPGASRRATCRFCRNCGSPRERPDDEACVRCGAEL